MRRRCKVRVRTRGLEENIGHYPQSRLRVVYNASRLEHFSVRDGQWCYGQEFFGVAALQHCSVREHKSKCGREEKKRDHSFKLLIVRLGRTRTLPSVPRRRRLMQSRSSFTLTKVHQLLGSLGSPLQLLRQCDLRHPRIRIRARPADTLRRLPGATAICC